MPDSFKTKSNLDRRGSTLHDDASASSAQSSKTSEATFSKSTKGKTSHVVPLKERDWRGESNGEMWWECLWDGMDGIGGTNKKGTKCFDRVRIWWRDVLE